ncbi:AAA domain-containing protein [Amycolatopsis sp. w19]|uniref:AAA domain-containing protein n=1 Tax=Amycolatopsis sp. w19 TaxID=3448134 RepID=UPI003F1D7F7D
MNDQARELELARRVSEAVFVVSPFRDIVESLRKEVGSWLLTSNRLGTVHTTQGKKADIFLLVLGTATDQARSRSWAAQTPNLLNVPVTRARRQVVVIGDYPTGPNTSTSTCSQRTAGMTRTVCSRSSTSMASHPICGRPPCGGLRTQADQDPAKSGDQESDLKGAEELWRQ